MKEHKKQDIPNKAKLPLGYEKMKVLNQSKLEKSIPHFFYVEKIKGEVRFRAFYKQISRLY